jgi:hypothetical protein
LKVEARPAGIESKLSEIKNSSERRMENDDEFSYRLE